MADKKITALTALNATGKVSSTDLLHIIDYSASPVNKKITVSDLLSNANTAISSYGAYTHDFGPTSAISGLSVVIPNATPAASAETQVVVNEDGNAFVDFRVETGLSASAFQVDSSLDTDNGSCNTVTINGDFAKVDFRVNSDTSTATTPLLHCDSITNGIAIGKEDPAATHLVDVAAVSGKSIKTAGGVDVTGVSTFTGNTSVTGNITCTGIEIVNGNEIITDSASAASLTVATTIFNMSANANVTVTLAAGTEGQIKYFATKAVDTGNSRKVRLHPVTSGTSTLQGLPVYIDFDAVGEGATLLYKDSKWNVIGMHKDVGLAAS